MNHYIISSQGSCLFLFFVIQNSVVALVIKQSQVSLGLSKLNHRKLAIPLKMTIGRIGYFWNCVEAIFCQSVSNLVFKKHNCFSWILINLMQKQRRSQSLTKANTFLAIIFDLSMLMPIQHKEHSTVWMLEFCMMHAKVILILLTAIILLVDGLNQCSNHFSKMVDFDKEFDKKATGARWLWKDHSK